MINHLLFCDFISTKKGLKLLISSILTAILVIGRFKCCTKLFLNEFFVILVEISLNLVITKNFIIMNASEEKSETVKYVIFGIAIVTLLICYFVIG